MPAGRRPARYSREANRPISRLGRRRATRLSPTGFARRTATSASRAERLTTSFSCWKRPTRFRGVPDWPLCRWRRSPPRPDSERARSTSTFRIAPLCWSNSTADSTTGSSSESSPTRRRCVRDRSGLGGESCRFSTIRAASGPSGPWCSMLARSLTSSPRRASATTRRRVLWPRTSGHSSRIPPRRPACSSR